MKRLAGAAILASAVFPVPAGTAFAAPPAPVIELVEAIGEASRATPQVGPGFALLLRNRSGGEAAYRVERWSFQPASLDDESAPTAWQCDRSFEPQYGAAIPLEQGELAAAVAFVDFFAAPRLRIRSSRGERFVVLGQDGRIWPDEDDGRIPPRPVERDIHLRVQGSDLQFRTVRSPEWRRIARRTGDATKTFEPLSKSEQEASCARTVLARAGFGRIEDWQLEQFVRELFPAPRGFVAYPAIMDSREAPFPIGGRGHLPVDHHRLFPLLEWPPDGAFVIHLLDVQRPEGPRVVERIARSELEAAVVRGAKRRGIEASKIETDPPVPADAGVTAMMMFAVTIRDAGGIGRENFHLPFCVRSKEDFLRAADDPDFTARHSPCR